MSYQKCLDKVSKKVEKVENVEKGRKMSKFFKNVENVPTRQWGAKAGFETFEV